MWRSGQGRTDETYLLVPEHVRWVDQGNRGSSVLLSFWRQKISTVFGKRLSCQSDLLVNRMDNSIERVIVVAAFVFPNFPKQLWIVWCYPFVLTPTSRAVFARASFSFGQSEHLVCSSVSSCLHSIAFLPMQVYCVLIDTRIVVSTAVV